MIASINDLPRNGRRHISELPEEVLKANWPFVLNVVNFVEKTHYVATENEAQRVRRIFFFFSLRLLRLTVLCTAEAKARGA